LMPKFWKPAAVAAAAAVLAWRAAPTQKSLAEALFDSAISAIGGHKRSNTPPLWQHAAALERSELAHLNGMLPPDEEWPACGDGRDPLYRCTAVPVGADLVLRRVAERLGAAWLTNSTLPDALPVMRLRPGSPGLPPHIDHLPDGSVPDWTVLVFLGEASATAAPSQFFFPASGLGVPAVPGSLLGWRNNEWEGDAPRAYPSATHRVGPVSASAPALDILLLPVTNGAFAVEHVGASLRSGMLGGGPGCSSMLGAPAPETDPCEAEGCFPCQEGTTRLLRRMLFGAPGACEACCAPSA